VSDGDSFLFEALVNPKTGQKLVDVIRVSVTEDPPMEEAVLSMKDASPDGQRPDALQHRHLPRQVIAFFLKGRGRYVISIKKRDGFETTAMLKTDRIEFSLGSDRFEWQSVRADHPSAFVGCASLGQEDDPPHAALGQTRANWEGSQCHWPWCRKAAYSASAWSARGTTDRFTATRHRSGPIDRCRR